MEAQDRDEDFGDEVPIGYRFTPTDEELVTHYLINKVFGNPLPAASVFQEIDASELYSKPPKSSVQFSGGEREWFFFIYGNLDEKNKEIRKVEDWRGHWRSDKAKALFDTNRNVVGFKIYSIYFSGGGLSKKEKKTHWRMDEYRLPTNFYTLHNFKEEWAVGRLRRGRDFSLGF